MTTGMQNQQVIALLTQIVNNQQEMQRKLDSIARHTGVISSGMCGDQRTGQKGMHVFTTPMPR